MEELAVIFTTASNEEEAVKIARGLVDEQLVACAQIVAGIRSFYRWEDAVQDDREHLLLLKTRRELVDHVAKRIQELHSYTTPEVVAVPSVGGSPEYAKWAVEMTRSPSAS